jgi:hypothetical protein
VVWREGAVSLEDKKGSLGKESLGERRLMVSSLFSASSLLISMTKLLRTEHLGVHCVSAALCLSAAGACNFPAASPELGRQLAMDRTENAVQMMG